MRGSRSVHASAIAGSDWPRAAAISARPRTFARVWSVSWSSVRERSRAIRESSGMPFA